VNGIHVCELVFISEMDVFTNGFNFRTIYQVGVLQQILVTNTTVLSLSDSREIVCCVPPKTPELDMSGHFQAKLAKKFQTGKPEFAQNLVIMKGSRIK